MEHSYFEGYDGFLGVMWGLYREYIGIIEKKSEAPFSCFFLVFIFSV